jgi:superfamily I DNA and RNA helicase
VPRIIRGVAGSGKTLILAFRAEYLARAATKPVLILCYANGIAGRLEDAMQNRGVEDRVQVLTFDSWCYRMLRTYGISAPSEREYPDYAKRLAANVSEVVKAADQGHIPTAQYDAVLIDDAEAHCVAEWFLRRKKVGYEWPQMACLYPEHFDWGAGRSGPHQA